MEALGSIDQVLEKAIPAIPIRHCKPGTMDPSGPDHDVFHKLEKSSKYPFVSDLTCRAEL